MILAIHNLARESSSTAARSASATNLAEAFPLLYTRLPGWPLSATTLNVTRGLCLYFCGLITCASTDYSRRFVVSNNASLRFAKWYTGTSYLVSPLFSNHLKCSVSPVLYPNLQACVLENVFYFPFTSDLDHKQGNELVAHSNFDVE